MLKLARNTENLFEILFVIFMAGLLYGMFRPEPPPDLFSHSDKAGHVLIFLAVTLTGRLTRIKTPDWLYWPFWGVFAVAIEYLQGALRELRIFSMGDAWANLAGVCAGLGLWLVVRYLLCRSYGEDS